MESGKSKILIVIIVLLLCAGCFVGGFYVSKLNSSKEDSKVEDKKDNTNDSNDKTNNGENNTNNNNNNPIQDETYDYTKDTKLKEMYELYLPNDWMGEIGNLLDVKEEVINAANLGNEIKNYLGYSYRIAGKKVRKESCKNYLYLDEKVESGARYSACDTETFLEDPTMVFDEKDLESSAKELFGNYTASNFYLGANRFKYDSSSKKYVHQSIPAGGVHPAAANKLVNGTKKGNTIVMTVLLSSKKDINEEKVSDSDYDYEYKFTFEVSNGNYIFKSLEKTLRK